MNLNKILFLDEKIDEGFSLDYIHPDGLGSGSAYETSERGAIRLSLPRRIGALSANLRIFNESGEDRVLSLNMSAASSQGMDIFEFRLDCQELGVGLYYFDIILNLKSGRMYCRRNNLKNCLSKEENSYGLFQITLSDFSHEKPRAAFGGVIYHVFVDRFKRGGRSYEKRGARIVPGEWENIPEYPAYRGAPLKNNSFYGGTLDGIRDSLSYFSSLGVNILYLSPIFESPSNHRYDTSDYMKVDPLLGGDLALKDLIDEAKKYGIKIILDGVFNHTGDDSIYFNRYGNYPSLGAYQSKESPYYSWYDFKSFPDKYTCWWDIEILPRLSSDKKEVKDFFLGEAGVVKKYSDMGIYGLRLDVCDELSDSFLVKLKDRLSNNGESFVIGEVWEDASNKIAYGKRRRYYLGDELDSVMNYPLREGLIEFILGRGEEKLRYAIEEVLLNAPKRIRDALMNILGTHDTERIITLLGEQKRCEDQAQLSVKRLSKEEKLLAKRRLTALSTVLYTLPGIPSVFYGDEVGLEGYHDPFNRMPYPYGKEDRELLSHFRLLGKIRRENEVYIEGDFSLLLLSHGLFAFKRVGKEYSFVTLVTVRKEAVKVGFDEPCLSVLDNKTDTGFELSSTSTRIFKIKNGCNMYLI